MAGPYLGTGGWSPGLVRVDEGLGGDIAFLASEHMMVKTAGITLDAAELSADSDGNKILEAGTYVGPVTATGKYTTPAAGGEHDEDKSGYLLESVNLRHGDVITGILLHGSVLEARVDHGTASVAAKAAVAGRIIFQ